MPEEEILKNSSKEFVLFNSVPDITPYLLPPLRPSRFPPTMNDVMPDFQTSYGRKSGLLSLTSRPSCTFAPIALSPPAGAEPPAGEPLPLGDGRSAPIAITNFFPSLSVPVDRGVRRLTRVRTHALSRALARACAACARPFSRSRLQPVRSFSEPSFRGFALAGLLLRQKSIQRER